MLSIAIIEDEDTAADVLCSYLDKYSKDNNTVFSVKRFYDAYGLLDNYKPIYDIIFMDIVLPKINGMEAAEKLRFLDKNVVLIFVTNMANYAVKGYEVDALSFIIKPVAYESFAMKMSKAINTVSRHKSFDISIPMDGAIKVISASKVYYIEISGHYLIYNTEEGKFKSRGTLYMIKSQLEAENFSQCNVGYLVNLKFVSGVKGDIVSVGSDDLRISRKRKKEFINALTNYLGRGT